MDYWIGFFVGVLVTGGVSLSLSYGMKIAYIKALRKELGLGEGKPDPLHTGTPKSAGVFNPYAEAEAVRAKYRTMWGPSGEGPGEPLR